MKTNRQTASPYHHTFPPSQHHTENSGIHSLSRTVSKKQLGSEDPEKMHCNLINVIWSSLGLKGHRGIWGAGEGGVAGLRSEPCYNFA